MSEARQELHRIINDREMSDSLLLVFANKQDLEQCALLCLANHAQAHTNGAPRLFPSHSHEAARSHRSSAAVETEGQDLVRCAKLRHNWRGLTGRPCLAVQQCQDASNTSKEIGSLRFL